MEFHQGLPETAAAPSGWESMLSFCAPIVSIDSENLPRCTRCQPRNARLPSGVEGALVGWEMILNDQQLRTYNDKKPWSRATAEEPSADAESSWIYEHPPPPWTLRRAYRLRPI